MFKIVRRIIFANKLLMVMRKGAAFVFVLSKGSSLGRYVFGSEISYNKAPPRLPGLGC